MAAEIAIVIAAYNAEATLDRAVRSALAAPEAAQVCIVDDGSHDRTAALAQTWAAKDARVTALSQSNAGPAAARNAALAATSAPWIAVLDADDYLLPGRFSALMAHAENADFIADTLIRIMDGAPAPAFAAPPFAPAALSFEEFVLGNLSRDDAPLDLGFLKPVMRRRFLDAHRLRYRPMRLGEDYELYARALLHGARFLVGGPAGYVSVDRPGSISNRHDADDLQRLRDCDDGLAAVRPLSSSEKRALRRHRTRVDCRLQWQKLIDAVKRRDAGAALSTFHSPPAALYLAAQLSEQAWLRGPARLLRTRSD